MSYTALYRMWRPLIFEEVVGQEHIIKTLENQIRNGNISHAYLFSGTRGTGKTSTAKILSRAVNCLNPQGYNPCNECEICRGILDESLMDIVEIDAASNNGVDDIRELRENVKYPPSKAKYKVYIIDEVHMLSQGAFNALLKTLEEPPHYVIFVLATTEPQKIPNTILSRCQRYDFKRVAPEDIKKRLMHILDQLEIEVEDRALDLIIKNSEGAVRDSQSILDRCISSIDGPLTYEKAVEVMGLVQDDYLFSVTEAIFGMNYEYVMGNIDHLVNDGKDIFQFIKGLINHFRNLMVSKVSEDLVHLIDNTEDYRNRIKQQGSSASINKILRTIDILTDLESDAKWSTQSRILLEVSLIKIMEPIYDESIEALHERIERLEKQVELISEEGIVISTPSSAGVASAKKPVPEMVERPESEQVREASEPERSKSLPDWKESIIKEPAERPIVEANHEMHEPLRKEPPQSAITQTQAQGSGAVMGETLENEPPQSIVMKADEAPEMIVPGDADAQFDTIQKHWDEIMMNIKKRKVQIHAFLIEGQLKYIESGNLMIGFDDVYGFHMDMVNRPENKLEIEKIIYKITHQKLNVKCDFNSNLSSSGHLSTGEKSMDDEEKLKSFLDGHIDKLEIME